MTDLAVPAPQPADYFVAQVQGVVGLGIRVGQALVGDWSRFSHAGILLPNDMVFEAEPGGAKIRTLEEVYARKGPIAWSQNPLDQATRQRICDDAISRKGAPYGWLTYPYIALDLVHWNCTALGSAVAKTKALICSQAVDAIYLNQGVHIFDDGRPAGKVSPGDLAQIGLICHVPGRG